MKTLHVLPGLGSGGTERMVANLMRTLERERFEAGVIGLLDPLFGTDLVETLAFALFTDSQAAVLMAG